MLSAIIRRLIHMIAVLFGISVLVFLIFFATPGANPAARIAGRNASPQTIARVERQFGLNKPLPVQYGLMMKKLFITQNLTSFVNLGEKVVPQVFRAAPITLSLVTGAAVIWIGFAVLIGLLAAAFRDTLIDRILMILSLIGISMPVFWVATMANLITQGQFHHSWLFSWVPPLGYVPFNTSPLGWFKALIIPWFTLAILYIGLYARVLRAALIETMQEDYIRTARAKGLSERQVLMHHALRSAMIGIVTLFGLDFGALVGGGALLTEVVFGLQGIGYLTYQALETLDLPMILATVIYASVFVVMSNAVVDILYAVIDPRARQAR
ncbi:MAG TPA: ABC transporter permease [Acidiphilium sp.]|nr:MAG: peptide ABC transporter permease [Acidiphilium sp. 21-60-14]OYV89855.1 MAG: peptide ABC transporter permease [Acidiphilium sp. 37-60-79]OZB39529.1 MAG: peptide ABC transporter permease [Acidiphilium sp. 34-60-192]HQT89312.1 ABC transporter permease [Acidiphilium sp.]HQU24406.1 ABC transporter permease [Acidiphilium sp.]